LTSSLNKLLEQFPQFGLLLHFTNSLFQHFQNLNVITGDELARFVRQYIEKWKDSQDIASHNMISDIDFSGKSVLVHSNSSAIHNLFGHLLEMEVFPVVWQTWSSPAGEGKLQAKRISKMGFETHLVHEDALGNFIGNLDLAILGADLVLDDRFLNKAGSFSISLLFNYFQKPVYVLGERRKKISINNIGQQQLQKLTTETEKPESELFTGGNKRITVHNFYFEFTPLSLVKNVFLD